MSFLLTAASDRTKYSLQRATLSFGTVKSIRYSGIRFHIFYCNSAGISDVFRYDEVFAIARFHCVTICQGRRKIISLYRRIVISKLLIKRYGRKITENRYIGVNLTCTFFTAYSAEL